MARDPEKPFFLFLHFYDVHTDFTPRQEYRERFVEPYSGRLTGSTTQLVNVRNGEETLSEADMRWLRQMYDAEIRQLDDLLGRFFAWLEDEELFDRTLFVVTSDHGEEFQEHGMFGHGRSLYEAVIRVPLIVVTPDGAGGRVVEGPVSLVDVAPSLLARADVPIPDRFEGTSFAHLLETDGWLTAARRWWRGRAETLAEGPVLSERLQASSAACVPFTGEVIATSGAASESTSMLSSASSDTLEVVTSRRRRKRPAPSDGVTVVS